MPRSKTPGLLACAAFSCAVGLEGGVQTPLVGLSLLAVLAAAALRGGVLGLKTIRCVGGPVPRNANQQWRSQRVLHGVEWIGSGQPVKIVRTSS